MRNILASKKNCLNFKVMKNYCKKNTVYKALMKTVIPFKLNKREDAVKIL